MKKLLLSLIILVASIGCRHNVPVYNFEALRDTLGLDSSSIFVEECSPLYNDSNPYNIEGPRLKALFYNVVYNQQYQRIDTNVFGVMRDNNIVFWGSGDSVNTAENLIKQTIDNRVKF